MRAITVHQPWASLVAANVKTIETRSWSTKYRGPLAIHAAKRLPKEDECPGQIGRDLLGTLTYWLPDVFTEEDQIAQGLMPDGDLIGFPLPFGMVVATCVLADVVPMVDEIPPQSEWREPWSCITVEPWPILNRWRGFGSVEPRYVGDQAPYDDFRPGRFAWMLSDIQWIKPVPARGRQQLWEWSESEDA